MFDLIKFSEALDSYKENFISDQWKNEKYKWEAIKHFQDNWDINAENFSEMLAKSLEKTGNLLVSAMYFPAGMIKMFAEKAPEEIRSLFLSLFDENVDVYERISKFKSDSEFILQKYGDGAKNHYQNESSISTYLWLRFPEKYYIYKISEIKEVSKFLNSDYQFKNGAYASNIRNFLSFYDEICEELSKDIELTTLLKSQLSDTCHDDSKFRTLTIDFGFYISRNFGKKKAIVQNIWKISHGTDNTSISEKYRLIFENRKVVVVHKDTRAKGFSSHKQGDDFVNNLKKGDIFYLCYGNNIKLLGEITSNKANPNLELEDGWMEHTYRIIKNASITTPYSNVEKWWTPNHNSTCIKVDVNDYSLFEDLILKPYFNTELSQIFDMRINEKGYWWLNANPEYWSFSNISVGDAEPLSLINSNGNKRRIYQNFLEAKVGDLIIGYETSPIKKIVALAKIISGQDGEKLIFEKVEDLKCPIEFSTLKNYSDLENMEYFINQQGSLFKLTEEEYSFILDLIREKNPLKEIENIEIYNKESFLYEVYMTESRYDALVSILCNKKNIILQGAPGVGKTFTAKKLAYSIMGEKDDDRIEFVQFHQNYSYEDFMLGYKPVNDGFELKYGVFYQFCQKATSQPDKEFFFIIDEINRGNISKIFGELLMLIEKDYRGTYARLAYNEKPFTVPENLYIIGMMNTADRSLAMIDYALRRRFSFFEIEPGFDSEGFIKYQRDLDNETLNELIIKVKELNKAIMKDKTLGKGFCIGHSYFCGQKTCSESWLRSVVDFDIIPMLWEYWFDEPSKVTEWENALLGVFQ